jgi:hypothetical protein
MEKPRLMDQVRSVIRVRHYSRRTEEAYTYWIRQFIPPCHRSRSWRDECRAASVRDKKLNGRCPGE